MASRPVPLTKEGLDKLQKELDFLQNVRRAEVAQRIHDSKELVGAQNVPEYEDARNEQAFVEGRIAEIEHFLQNAVMIEDGHKDHQKVGLGSTVRVKDHQGKIQAYTIVGVAEADPKAGKISNESPVGAALLGHKLGEEVEFKAPAGILKWKVVSID